jgi:predicted ribosomally synthesized peptide with SipW-like signal peptide
MSRSAKVRAVLALGTVLGIGTTLTLAAWTDSGVVTGTFSTGSIDLKLDGVDTLPVVTNLALTNAAPGAVTYAPLTVSNAGTLNFTYTFTNSITTASTSTPLLESVLNVGVKVVSSAATCTQAGYDASSTVVLASQKLNTLTTTTARSLTATTGSEVLCFKVDLPTDASTNVQSRTTTAAFTFTATQS